ncbi:hypothetical protein PoB_001632400 [Plakobranchus ocellatus]|uniref:Uncharacterized protein n=1 Tax=Plakobranchus ocellatus TaxID=259542 RepID=A0AAV3Z3E4_9GAST|nr:hypothetical protein PoB_001632400 [Plakobranchus ocellatus]
MVRQHFTEKYNQEIQQKEKTDQTSILHQYSRTVSAPAQVPGKIPYNAGNKTWVTHKGKMQMNMNSNRMPMVLIRVVPEMERTSNAYNLYHYLINMDVEYFSEVEWIYTSPDPAYTNVGISGPWFRNTDAVAQRDIMWQAGPALLLEQTRRLRNQINKDTDGYPGDRFNYTAAEATTTFM